MRKKVGLLAVCVCLTSMSAFGQVPTLQVSMGVGGPNILVCQDLKSPTSGIASLTASCGGSWDHGNGNSGSGSGTATATYGVLQAYATAQTTVIAVESSPLSTATTGGGSFTDYLTFPSLTGGAYLKATLTVSGSASGDLPASNILTTVNINGNSFGQCNISAFTGGSCTTSIPVSPGDQVRVDGSIGSINASSNIEVNSIGSDSATLNYNSKRSYGAHYGFVIVDASGKPIGGARILSASGTKYPTK